LLVTLIKLVSITTLLNIHNAARIAFYVLIYFMLNATFFMLGGGAQKIPKHQQRIHLSLNQIHLFCMMLVCYGWLYINTKARLHINITIIPRNRYALSTRLNLIKPKELFFFSFSLDFKSIIKYYILV